MSTRTRATESFAPARAVPILLAVLAGALPCAGQSGVRSAMTSIPDETTTVFKHHKGDVVFNYQEREQSYYNIRLTDFDIAKDRKLWKHYEPVVVVRISVGDKTYTRVLGSGNIENQEDRIRSRINENLLGPFPYQGGEVKVDVAIIRAAVDDKLKETLDGLKGITEAFGVTNVLEYTKISDAIKGLADHWLVKDRYPLVSFAHTWEAQPPDAPVSSPFREGYFIIHQAGVDLDKTKLAVTQDDAVLYDGKPLTTQGLDYAIIQFHHALSRTDYQSRPFYSKYQEAQANAQNGQAAAMDAAFSAAMAILYADGNFTPWDRKTLHTKLYRALVPEIRQHVPTYAELKTPLVQEYGAQTNEQAAVVSELREREVSVGKTPAGASIDRERLETSARELLSGEERAIIEKRYGVGNIDEAVRTITRNAEGREKLGAGGSVMIEVPKARAGIDLGRPSTIEVVPAKPPTAIVVTPGPAVDKKKQ